MGTADQLPALSSGRVNLRRAVLGALGVTILGWLAVTEVTAVRGDQAARTGYKTDFHATIWQPAWDVLHGIGPYADPHAAGFVPATVYPPFAYLPALPLAWLSVDPATVVFQGILVAAAVATLLVLGVRDWRCHVLWLFTPLMLVPILIGNNTPLVVLCAALVWRWRERALLAAAALTVAICMKLFLAPLWVWFVITRRYRAAAYSAIAVPLVILGSWAVIGFQGLLDYPEILRIDSKLWAGDGAYVQALVLQSGAGRSVALGVGVAVAVVLVAVAWRSSELVAFGLVSAAALALTPIGWVFYAGILIVPLAVRNPRFAPPWLVLAAFWVSWYHSPVPYKSATLSVLTIGAAIWLLVAAFRTRERQNRDASAGLKGSLPA